MTVAFDVHGAFWNLGNLDLTLDLPSPLLGQHSLEIPRTIGLDEVAISSLIDSGVVAVPTVSV